MTAPTRLRAEYPPRGAALYLVDAGKPLPANSCWPIPSWMPNFRRALVDWTMTSWLDCRGTCGSRSDDCIRTAENYVGRPVSMAPSYAMPGYAVPAGLPPTALLAYEYDGARGSIGPEFPCPGTVDGGAAALVCGEVSRDSTHDPQCCSTCLTHVIACLLATR